MDYGHLEEFSQLKVIVDGKELAYYLTKAIPIYNDILIRDDNMYLRYVKLFSTSIHYWIHVEEQAVSVFKLEDELNGIRRAWCDCLRETLCSYFRA